MYWFIGEKSRTETRENTYVMTMVSRIPRQIVGFDVALDKSPSRIQAIVDNAPEAKSYCTDGYLGYVVFIRVSIYAMLATRMILLLLRVSMQI